MVVNGDEYCENFNQIAEPRYTVIYKDDKRLLIDLDKIEDLEKAMRFKAENIKARAEPELFMAVADALVGKSNGGWK